MIGASTKAATAVWVGNVTGDANLRDLRFESGEAATARHRIWPRIMTVADNAWGGDAFQEPDSSAFRVIQADVPDVRGKSPAEARSILEKASFTVVDGAPQNSDVQAGLIAGLQPVGVGAARGDNRDLCEPRAGARRASGSSGPGQTGQTRQARETGQAADWCGSRARSIFLRVFTGAATGGE